MKKGSNHIFVTLTVYYIYTMIYILLAFLKLNNFMAKVLLRPASCRQEGRSTAGTRMTTGRVYDRQDVQESHMFCSDITFYKYSTFRHVLEFLLFLFKFVFGPPGGATPHRPPLASCHRTALEWGLLVDKQVFYSGGCSLCHLWRTSVASGGNKYFQSIFVIILRQTSMF